MKVIASIHVLGSTTGYQTMAASQDVTQEETRRLEVLGFGQSNRDDFYESLWQQPAGMGRPLPSGRYAVTRCFPGDRDTAGRRTLLFATLIFSAEDWIHRIAHQLSAVLNNSDIWRFREQATNQRLKVNLPAQSPANPPRSQTLAAMDAWLNTEPNATLVVLPDSPTNASVVTAIPGLLPATQRLAISWGLRILSPSAPVSLATAIKGTEQGGRRAIVRPRTTSSLRHPYVQSLEAAWPRDHAPPTRFSDEFEDVAQASLDFEDESPDPQLSTTGQRRTRLTWIFGAAAAMVLGATIVGTLLSGTLSDSAGTTNAGEANKTHTQSPVPQSLAENIQRTVERFDQNLDNGQLPDDNWIHDAKDIQNRLDRLRSKASNNPTIELLARMIHTRIDQYKQAVRWRQNADQWLNNVNSVPIDKASAQSEGSGDAKQLNQLIENGRSLVDASVEIFGSFGSETLPLRVRDRLSELRGHRKEIRANAYEITYKALKPTVDELSPLGKSRHEFLSKYGGGKEQQFGTLADGLSTGDAGASEFNEIRQRVASMHLREFMKKIQSLRQALQKHSKNIRDQRQKDIQELKKAKKEPNTQAANEQEGSGEGTKPGEQGDNKNSSEENEE